MHQKVERLNRGGEWKVDLVCLGAGFIEITWQRSACDTSILAKLRAKTR
jgi:hypothetical protein